MKYQEDQEVSLALRLNMCTYVFPATQYARSIMYNENNVCTVGEQYPDDQLHLMVSVNPVDTFLFLEGSEVEKMSNSKR